MTDTALAERGIGDNMPPPDADPLRDRLTTDYVDQIERRDELLAGAERVPEDIENEATAQKTGDFIKQLSGAAKNANASRIAEKEPYLAGGRGVDGFFKAITEPLADAKKDIESRLNIFLRAKAVAERRAREEVERQAREAAAKAAKEAADRIAALKDEEDLEAAIAAEEIAKHAEADRLKAAKEAEANQAEMSRTRGDYGSVASLRTFMDFKDMDRAKLDLEALRQHLNQDALEKAVRSYVKAGGRELAGVTIFENSQAVVR